jgi:NitT/TauT family transport system permease protein
MTDLAGAAPVAMPRSAGGRVFRLVRFVVPPMCVAAGVVGIWLFVTYGLLRQDQRPFLPPPQEVVSRGFLDWDRLQPILTGLGRTTIVAVTGLAIAFVIGTFVAVVMSQTWWLERTLYPYAVILQTVPLVAIAPLVGLKMGYSDPSRVVICVLISIFPIIANTLFGLKSATAAQHDLFTLQQATRRTRLWKLQFPTALPAIFTGLRISAGLSVIGAIVGEFFFRAGDPSKAGLGRQLSVYQSQQRTHLVITALFFSCVLGVGLFAVFSMIGNHLTKNWTEPVQRGPRRSAPRRPAGAGRLAVDDS